MAYNGFDVVGKDVVVFPGISDAGVITDSIHDHYLPPMPPTPIKRKIQVLVDNKWIFLERQTDIPIPPTPKPGYRERFVDDQWVFVKNPLKVNFKY